ncbi:threonyl-tRNA synthetase, putative [Bodo saltans]|uniref:threonine--tRNA ligase n=1 Tax=Bodo saltans TaxID=75058 RepID=A0A0S4KJ29_BODSA|nr:threonyl-tRNA synthetase, putative [Bodo saltans]|eukprot:CUI14539.1 threonyl-tRNA synthetase, putative [Bodo saltans]
MSKDKAGSKKATDTVVDFKTLAEPSFWKHRIDIFERLYAAQQEKYQAQKAPIKVTLPDGKVHDAESWVTTPIDIAKKLSNSLPDKVFVARVNDQLWDLTRPFEADSTLELLDWEDPEARKVFWHSSSHVLGYALERVFQAKLSVGPPLEDGGFFYEGQTSRPVTEADYKSVEQGMQELVKQKSPYQRLVVSKADALSLFEYTHFKSKILASKVPEGGSCTVYRCGNLIDPCRGPHLPDTGRVKSYAVTKNSSSYFEGKAENEVLQRVYAIAFPKEAQLKEWKTLQEEAAKRDHRNIGRQQELFGFHDVSPGSAFWLPHGARIYNTLIEFQRKQYRRRGFDEVVSPNIYNAKLWMVSGHWQKYADAMFRTTCEHEEYGLKPMNCPGHCVMFGMRPRSYKELPVRFADFGTLHRNELSGALTGLTRVRRFQQDDAHIFCRMDQITDEIESALGFLQDVYGVFNWSFNLKLSTRPDNKLGTEEVWDTAEGRLLEALNRFCDIPDELDDPFTDGAKFKFDGKPASIKKLKALVKKLEKTAKDGEWKGPRFASAWEENPGDGAFYGPKIDIVVEDALKRKHQCATIQLDFNLPERFGLKYTLPGAAGEAADDESKEEKPKAKAKAEKAAKGDEKHADPAAPAPAAAAESLHPTANPQHPTDPHSPNAQIAKEMYVDRTLASNQARPVMIHRAIFGSLERCIAILCEHYGGKWPFWLSPRQVIVIPVSKQYEDYANEVKNFFHAEGFFAEADVSTLTLEKKIRNAELGQHNFIFVVGQEELDNRAVNVRTRDNARHGTRSLADANDWLQKLAKNYSAEY